MGSLSIVAMFLIVCALLFFVIVLFFIYSYARSSYDQLKMHWDEMESKITTYLGTIQSLIEITREYEIDQPTTERVATIAQQIRDDMPRIDVKNSQTFTNKYYVMDENVTELLRQCNESTAVSSSPVYQSVAKQHDELKNEIENAIIHFNIRVDKYRKTTTSFLVAPFVPLTGLPRVPRFEPNQDDIRESEIQGADIT